MMNPTICLLVGDTHTEHCGVKDYALRLAKALGEFDVHAEVMAPPSWETKDFLPFAKKLRERKFDILHLQYPSIGHRASLWPHVMGRLHLGGKFVVTLHEYRALPKSQRLSTNLFRWTAEQLLFTTDAEMQHFGPSGAAQKVIFIGSNVPASPQIKERTTNVLHFGQIRPNKGIEHFLALARKSQDCGLPFTFEVMGSVPERKADHYKKLRSETTAKVKWTIGPSFDEVAQIMAGSLAAYLPFPDGATYRRGSLQAALTNALPVLTPIGPETPSELLPVILPTPGVDQALSHLERLRQYPDEAKVIGSAGSLFSQRFSWTRIAQMHKEMYWDVWQSGSRVGHQPFVAGTESVVRGQD
jgi:glycosyltransferase involved in cell wall biosynthesis